MLIFKINFYVLDILVTYFRLSPGSQHITYRYMSLKKPQACMQYYIDGSGG